MVLERCRFRLLRVVYFFGQSAPLPRTPADGGGGDSSRNPDPGSNNDNDPGHDSHQLCVRAAVGVLGRLLALPFMAVTALPISTTPASTTHPSPSDEQTKTGRDTGAVGVVPWVLTLRTPGSSSSRSNGSGRRRVVLPCLDELYQPSLARPQPAARPQQQQPQRPQ